MRVKVREIERESHGSYVDLIRQTCVLLRVHQMISLSLSLSLPLLLSIKTNNSIMIMVLNQVNCDKLLRKLFHIVSYDNTEVGGSPITDQRYVIRIGDIWLGSRGEPGKGER